MTAGSRLELTWAHKNDFLLIPKDDNGKPVWVDRDHPASREVRLTNPTHTIGEVGENVYADNTVFVGDSLDALRIMCDVPEYAQEYRGKVKLVYIDPPFNTGQTFTHYDDWMEHSVWLSFMKDRLALIYQLLSPDGSVWIHLDDAEVHRMRCLLDEVFGAQNFVESITVQANPKGRQLSRFFATSHETILIYARNLAIADLLCGSTDEVDLKDFPLRENGVPYRLLPLRNTNKKFNPSTRPNLHYPLYVSPNGEVTVDEIEGSTKVYPVFGDGQPAVWRWGEPKARLQVTELFGREVNGSQGRRVDVFQKDYASPDRIKKYQSIWTADNVGSTDSARAENTVLFPGMNPFSTPKPERLLERIIHVASNPGDVVVDVFGGSGTTAAVAHKMGRRWVTAELNPSTVRLFIMPRLAKVVAGDDPGGITSKVGWVGGGGFRVVEVGESMFVVDDGDVFLAEWCVGEPYRRAVAGQLGYTYTPDDFPLCGRRGLMRLAVFDGTVGAEEVADVVAKLGVGELVTVVGSVVLPSAQEYVKDASPGSRVVKSPRDITRKPATRTRRHSGDVVPEAVVEEV